MTLAPAVVSCFVPGCRLPAVYRGRCAGHRGVPILEAKQVWTCPNCVHEERLNGPVPNVYHPCRGLRGILAPMVRAGTKAKVEAVERGDYINGEHVQLANGRPVMAVITTRDDGQDVTVFASTATGNGETRSASE